MAGAPYENLTTGERAEELRLFTGYAKAWEALNAARSEGKNVQAATEALDAAYKDWKEFRNEHC